MYCEEKLKLRSHDTRYCLIEVGTKAGVTVIHLIPIITGVVRLIPSCGEVFLIQFYMIKLINYGRSMASSTDSHDKMKNKIYHAIRSVPKFNCKNG
jgi:hypothetical protein